MRGLKTFAGGMTLAAGAAILAPQAANALATYSATADIQVSAYSPTYTRGWSPVAPFTDAANSTYALGGAADSGETVLTDIGTTTHSYVPVSSVYNKVYANTASRKVVNASKTLSGSAQTTGGASAEVQATGGPWTTYVYLFNKDPNAIDAIFSASVTLDLLTSISDPGNETAYAGGTVSATLTTPGSITQDVDAFDLDTFSLNGSGTGDSTGVFTYDFTVAAGSYSYLAITVDLEGAAISNPEPVPLPAALPMLGLALGGLGFVARRRAKNAKN